MIQKTSLREQIRAYLLQEMAKGKMAPGSPLALAEMARTLEVSVTPIREALNQLKGSGLVQALPNRGFILAPLSLSEAREIYPMISLLEGYIVRLSRYVTTDLSRLEAKNEKFKAAGNIREAVLLDDQFHAALLSPAQNATVLRILSDLKIRVLFYELEFQKDLTRFVQSGKDHDKIIRQIKKGQVDAAAESMDQHWRHSLVFIQERMEQKGYIENK